MDRLTDLQSKRNADERFLSHRETHELLRLQEQEIERLSKHQLTETRCPVCCGELSYCGDQGIDGPALDCLVCRQQEKIERLTLEVNKLATQCGQWETNVAERDREIERLLKHITQLAHDHPDTPVTWPYNGLTCYQDIHDWASYVVHGGREGGGDDE
jgi:hypothetical protein